MFLLQELEVAHGSRLLAGPLDLELDLRGGLLLGGPSGSGKSSLLRLLAGLSRPRRGVLFWKGLPLAGRLQEHRRCVHLVDQRPLLPGSTLRQCLCQGLELRGLPLPADSRLREGLDALALPLSLEHDPARLSGGESLRVALLRGLLLPVEALLLDEPSAGLDDEAARQVMDVALAAGAPPFLVVSHDERWRARCARRYELRQGDLHEA